MAIGALMSTLPRSSLPDRKCSETRQCNMVVIGQCLLERAKRAVEIAIEDGEAAAMGWMSEYQQTHL